MKRLCPALWLCLAVPASGSVVINEIHHSPDVKQQRVEFIELYNAGATAVNLAGWKFTSGVDFTFPAGTQLASGAYLVVAQDPAALAAKFGASNAVGPWLGRLANEGEDVVLADAAGVVVDAVDYRLGFPWPTVGDEPGYSIELIHPSLDSGLGGNWRASVVGEVSATVTPLFEAREAWRYFKGTAEASDPTTAWREFDFNDSAWTSGTTPLGYDTDEVGVVTTLGDMPDGYRQVFFRKHFTLSDISTVEALKVQVLYDDGFKLWVNGTLLLNVGLPATEVPFDANASANGPDNEAYVNFDVSLPAGVLRPGDNVIAVQLANISLSGSSDCYFDARAFAISRLGERGPSPGQRNITFATNAPPAIRQVAHTPRQPRSGQAVQISARVTDPDGVASATLEYQLVAPGNYVEITDDAFRTNWTSLTMQRGTDDTNVFTITLPGSLSRARHLLRYRVSAQDARGLQVRVPHADDPQPNFAFFCYNGVPAWTGAVQPGITAPFTVGTNEMNRLPVYHLIAKKTSVENCTWRDRSHGDEYFWNGTLVYDGDVYDHIRMRPRGGVWRYAMGKNMWKFDFNRGHDFQARDNWGRPIATPWSKLNLGANIQQGNFEHRGEQGMFESVGFRLFQLVGQPAMHSAYVQFRIIDEANEASRDSQYDGDFWGCYLALEQPDGRFLDEHGLPDGNLYKMEGGFGEPNNLGPDGPVNSSDLRAFLDAYSNSDSLTESWWRTNLNLPAYYNYQAIVQAIHHYDIAFGKNYFYYHNPDDGRWMVVPWDLDLTWADNMFPAGQQGGDEPFKSRVLSNFSTDSPQYPGIAREFRNRVREIRDLLWNQDEAFRLVDEYARLARGTNVTSLLDADRAQWDYNPVMADGSIVNLNKAGQGRYYKFTPYADVPRTFDGAIEILKRYIVYRASNPSFSLDTMSREPNRPAQPSLSYTGPAGFAMNRLTFRAGGYAGAAAFGSVKFRIGEITRPGHPAYRPDEPLPYEIQPVWESAEFTTAVSEVTVPQEALRVGRLYRARVRYTDNTGRSSNWSPPVEFTTGEPDNATALVANLQLTELMYNPPPEGFEFLELHNASPTETLRLDGATFTAGLDFTFPTNSTLAPGAYALLLGTTNVDGFLAHYAPPAGTPLFGPFDGNLSNGGETLTLKTAPGGAVIFSVLYDDELSWPTLADGFGNSLVPQDGGPADLSDPAHWRASRLAKGSPGRDDSAEPPAQFEFAPPQLDASGLKLQFNTASGVQWVLESSADLVNWTPVSTNTGPGSFTLPVNGGPSELLLRAVAR